MSSDCQVQLTKLSVKTAVHILCKGPIPCKFSMQRWSALSQYTIHNYSTDYLKNAHDLFSKWCLHLEYHIADFPMYSQNNYPRSSQCHPLIRNETKYWRVLVHRLLKNDRPRFGERLGWPPYSRWENEKEILVSRRVSDNWVQLWKQTIVDATFIPNLKYWHYLLCTRLPNSGEFGFEREKYFSPSNGTHAINFCGTNKTISKIPETLPKSLFPIRSWYYSSIFTRTTGTEPCKAPKILPEDEYIYPQ